MLTRLTDRIDASDDGEVVVRRYGTWGTSSEIEVRNRKFYVVHPNKKEKKFKTRAEAELYLAGTLKYR